MRRLTDLQKNVLLLALDGKSNREIADEVGTDQQCIKNRLRAAFRKIGVRCRRELLPVAATVRNQLTRSGDSAYPARDTNGRAVPVIVTGRSTRPGMTHTD